MAFSDLPDELVEDIGFRLESNRDVAALVRSSSRLCRIFGDFLYLQDEKRHYAGALDWATWRGRPETLMRAHRAGVQLSRHPHLFKLAVTYDQQAVVETLLSLPDIDLSYYPSHDWLTPLGMAVSKGNVGIVQTLINHGVDINQNMRDRSTPTIIAATHGRFEILKLLLNSGADPNARTVEGHTPLMRAAAGGFVDLVELLLQSGADMLARSASGWTCLHLAAFEGRTRVVKLLLDRGVSASQISGDGWMPLLLAARSQERLSTLQLLIEGGANISALSRGGLDPLMMAAERNCIDAMKMLLDHGASTSSLSRTGKSSLMIASSLGLHHAVGLLLLNGADVNLTSDTRWTALMEASYCGSRSAVRVLLAAGADVEAVNADGWTALFAATYTNQRDVVDLLLDRGAGRTLGWRNRAGQTPAIRAAHIGATSLIKVFLAAPTFDADQTDSQGRSPLFHAAMRGYPDVVEALLPRSKTANSRDRYGTTPIFAAARNGHDKVVRLLLASRGWVDPGERDIFGKTLMETARESRNEKLTALLREHAQRMEDEAVEGGQGENGAEDGVSGHSDHIFQIESCWCDVCCRCTDHGVESFVCDVCDGGNFLVCSDCASTGLKCQDDGHSWRTHVCSLDQ